MPLKLFMKKWKYITNTGIVNIMQVPWQIWYLPLALSDSDRHSHHLYVCVCLLLWVNFGYTQLATFGIQYYHHHHYQHHHYQHHHHYCYHHNPYHHHQHHNHHYHHHQHHNHHYHHQQYPHHQHLFYVYRSLCCSVDGVSWKLWTALKTLSMTWSQMYVKLELTKLHLVDFSQTLWQGPFPVQGCQVLSSFLAHLSWRLIGELIG